MPATQSTTASWLGSRVPRWARARPTRCTRPTQAGSDSSCSAWSAGPGRHPWLRSLADAATGAARSWRVTPFTSISCGNEQGLRVSDRTCEIGGELLTTAGLGQGSVAQHLSGRPGRPVGRRCRPMPKPGHESATLSVSRVDSTADAGGRPVHRYLYRLRPLVETCFGQRNPVGPRGTATYRCGNGLQHRWLPHRSVVCFLRPSARR